MNPEDIRQRLEQTKLLIQTARAFNTNPYAHPETLEQIDAAAAAAGVDSSDPNSSRTDDDYSDRIVHIIPDWFEDDTDMSSNGKPVLFYGKPRQLRDVTTYVEIKTLTDDTFDDNEARKAAYLASLFRGPALTWLATQLKTKAKEELLGDYDNFKRIVQEAFGQTEIAERQQADRTLATLVQRTSVRDYALKYRPLREELEWNEATAIAHFKRGLKLHIREALITSSGDIVTLEQAIEKAQQLDDELFASKRGRFNSGNLQKQGNREFKGKCNKCGQFGHKARNCRIKNEEF